MADRLNFEALQGWYEQVLTAAKPHLTPENIRSLAINATNVALEHAKNHPYSTAVSVISIGLTPILGSGWLAAPFLKLIGFTPLGPAAGGLAAWYQATFLGGYISPQGWFAAAQRLAMG